MEYSHNHWQSHCGSAPVSHRMKWQLSKVCKKINFFFPLYGKDTIRLHPFPKQKQQNKKKVKNKPLKRPDLTISYLTPCRVSPRAEKTTTAISPWAVDYHLCWNKSTLPLWTQWDLRASGGDLPTRGAFNSIQKRRQSGYTNSARSNTAFGDWGWQWDNVDDLKESAIGDYQYTEFMEACIHKYIHMTFSVHSRQSVVAKRLCSKMYYASF